jgi:hypothetical protein
MVIKNEEGRGLFYTKNGKERGLGLKAKCWQSRERENL